MVKEKAICTVMVLALAAVATPAFAGEIGATSRASLTISVSVAPRFEVRNIASEADPAASPAGSQSRGMCISANTSTRMYAVALIGPEPAHTSPDPGPQSPPLSFQWTSLERRGDRADIAAGRPAGGFLASARPCDGASANARLTVKAGPDSGGSEAGPQSATLLIIPE